MKPLILAVLLPFAAVAAEKPNILLILADDLGWSDPANQGSEISTPNLDRLAAEGGKFRQFYNAARCAPTRASLLTGLYSHQTGVAESAGGRPGGQKGPYQGYLDDSAKTLAEALKPAGYRNYHSGKWNVAEVRPGWPIDRGFDHAFGLISGAMNYYDISKDKSPTQRRTFARDGEVYNPPADGRYITTEFTKEAIAFLDGHRKEHADSPWFLYLAYTAPHWPLQAPEEVVQKYLDLYRDGWQPVREARHRRQIESGLLPEGTPLSPPDGADWGSLSEEKKADMTRRMAIYAAMIEVMDTGIGSLLENLSKAGELDNTVIFFLADNGGCSEGGPLAQNYRPDLTGVMGSGDSFHNYGQSWSNVSNTPLRGHKAGTHEGGMRSPFFVRWPGSVKPGTVSDAVGHVIDLMPTLCEIAGATPPEKLPGKSLVPELKGGEGSARKLGWDHIGASAWREGDWKLVRRSRRNPWELYDLSKDPNELKNLADTEKEKVETMTAAWLAWAGEVGVRDIGR